ncbi:MAG: glycosyltransferase family 4 protein [Bacteroidota bacterium]|nr:glycosyltransferase family 4 protein [Bacteroidota bacterium]
MNKTILIMVDWFYPGYKAGGPITACYNLAMLLKDNYRVCIFTSDRDLNDNHPYMGISPDTWVKWKENVFVYYATPPRLGWANISRQIRAIAPSCIYLNSMFSYYFTICPLLLKMMRSIGSRVVLSPRGMLRDTALASKSFKKNLFLSIMKFFHIQDLIYFHATDEEEQKDIRRTFGERVDVVQVMDIPPAPEKAVITIPKQPGALKLIFVGRIHPIKNLHFILQVLRRTEREVALTVIGPAENEEYFHFCKGLAEELPSNILVHFEGEIPHPGIRNRILQHHFLILPTLGENYGHVIIESFCAGRPVIITNRTPWQQLSSKRIGWDLPLNDEEQFLRAIDRAAGMQHDEFTWWCACSLAYAHSISNPSNYRDKYASLFESRPSVKGFRKMQPNKPDTDPKKDGRLIGTLHERQETTIQ